VRPSHVDDGVFYGADCAYSHQTCLCRDAFHRDTETQAEAPAYHAKVACSQEPAPTGIVLVAARSLGIASLVGQKWLQLIGWYRCARDVRLRHKADIDSDAEHVRFRG
jgi:hypothetical protein